MLALRAHWKTYGRSWAGEKTLSDTQPPNKRLKLAGTDRLKGSGVLCPWRGTDVVPRPCAGERVARSLSAIR